MDRGAWQAAVRGVAKSWTQLKRLSTYRSEVLFERGIVRDIRASEIWLVLKILRGKANQFLIHFCKIIGKDFRRLVRSQAPRIENTNGIVLSLYTFSDPLLVYVMNFHGAVNTQ